MTCRSGGTRAATASGSPSVRSKSVASPLDPAEPLDLLDVALVSAIDFDLRDGHRALVYVRSGGVQVRAGGSEQSVPAGHAVVLHGGGGAVTFGTSDHAHFLVLSGAEIREPVVVDGPFIMNDRSQIEAAAARYRAGEMGRLGPLVDDWASLGTERRRSRTPRSVSRPERIDPNIASPW